MSTQTILGNPAPVLSPEEQKQIVLPPSKWDDRRAAAIAYADFKKAEQFRSNNHDRRFRTSDELYQGWVQKRVWENTRIPRASVPVLLLFEQIQALLPSVIGALFSDNLNFDASPRPGSTLAQALAVRDLLRYQLQDIGEEYRFITVREVLKRACEQGFQYGNGIIEFGWLLKTVKRVMWGMQQIPERQMMNHPIYGPGAYPTGRLIPHRFQKVIDQTISKPIALNIDIRDFYIDPNCPSTNVQEAGYCAVRQPKTVQWLIEQAQSDTRIKLPTLADGTVDVKTLIEAAKQKSMSQGDSSKAQTEAFRGNTWTPSIDGSTDPNQARLNLIRYFQCEREVWLIENLWDKPIYNEANELGMLRFLNVAYVPVPNRFYGISLADVVEGDQRLAEAIINARIDELNLMIHPPIIRRKGATIPSSAKRLRPGVEWEVDGNPKEDIVRMEMGNVTAQSFVEVDALERRVQKYTGVTDLAVLGSPAAGGNSANRTATGVQSQSAASGKRIQYLVENIEDETICPMLYILHALNRKFLDPNQAVQIIGPESQLLEYDPLDIINASVKFEMKAASKLRQRAALQAGGLQMLMQTVLNPGLIQMAAQMGQMPNFETWDELVSDAYSIPEMSLWKPMTPQAMQLMQMPSPDKRAAMQMQTERLQAQGEHQEAKSDTALLQTVLKPVMENYGVQKALTGYEPEPPQGGKDAA